MSDAPRNKNPLAPILIVLFMMALIVAAVMFFIKPELFGRGTDQTAQTTAVQTHVANKPDAAAKVDASTEEVQEPLPEDWVEVTDLSVNKSLPSEWLNVLLVGSDERDEGERARTDTIVICSINTATGQVKLASVLRDTAVAFKGVPSLPGLYRINAANYYGGERLLMKTLNECFDLNIENYVHVNFYGFQQLVQALGGVEVDITEAEQEVINERIVEQAYWAWKNGHEDDKLKIPYRYLEAYGPDVHLDGRMTLAYTRLRKIDNDYARTERQRTVLTKLLGKVRKLGASQLLNLGMAVMQYVETNMTLDEILTVAIAVCNAEDALKNAETTRFPINDSYVQEQRNNEDMLYDTDWKRNAVSMYGFLYGGK